MGQWTTNDMPNLQGKTAIVTGANSGLGLETTRALAAKGAHVIMACRNLSKAREAQALIIADLPTASLDLAPLDLASLVAVRAFAADFQQNHERLDLLFNNAGIMAVPRSETADGFETQFGTNHLGHFALTGLLLPTLLATPASRVITTTSMARSAGRIKLDDLQRQHVYGRWEAYGQSKRANLLFAFELQRRLREAGVSTLSIAAHPGASNTNLQSTSARISNARIESFLYSAVWPLISQSALMGTLPQLYAGTAEQISGGELVGPSGGMRGYPKIDLQAQKEYDKSLAASLWEASVKLTDVDYSVLPVTRFSETAQRPS